MKITVENMQKFIDFAEELVPGFKAKLAEKLKEKENAELKEKENAELLQQEQNLTEEIEVMKKTVADCQAVYDTAAKGIELAGYNLTTARAKLANLMTDRAAVHKKWIALNPAKPCKKTVISLGKDAEKHESDSSDIRKAFEIVYSNFMTEPGIGYCKEYKTKMFKRFDNLIHGRCKTTEMFGYDWQLEDVIEVLNKEGYVKLADDIDWFNTYCLNK